MPKIIYFILLLNLFTQDETGLALIKNFSYKAYNASPQNWCIVQDHDGFLYFGNTDGILQYDGYNWRLIQTKNKAIVRTLALSTDNKIYYGSSSEFGYLSHDTTGKTVTKELSKLIPEPDREFSDVWKINILGEKVFFFTRYKIFLYEKSKFKIFHIDPLSLPLQIDDNYIYGEKSKGLMVYKEGKFRNFAGGDFYKDKMTSFILPYANKKYLLGTRRDGLFIYHNGISKPFISKIDKKLKTSSLSDAGLSIGNGHYIIPSRKSGIMIIDSNGKEKMSLSKAEGLGDRTVYDVFMDKEGAAWLAMDNGISRVEPIQKLQFFGEYHGVKGTVEDILRHEGYLYFASRTGVYKYTDLKNKFDPVNGIKGQAITLLNHGNTLLAGTSSGVYEIKNNRAELIKKSYTYKLVQSIADPSRVYICQSQRFSTIYKDKNWLQESEFNLNNYEIIDLKEHKNSLWLATKYNGVLVYDFSLDNGKFILSDNYRHYKEEHGLGSASGNKFLKNREDLIVISRGKPFYFDPEKKSFFPEKNKYIELLAGNKEIKLVKQMNQGSQILFFAHGLESGLAVIDKVNNIQYIYDKRFINNNLRTVYPDGAFTWFGNSEGIYRLNLDYRKIKTVSYKTHIRLVKTSNDSVLYWGNRDVRRELFLNYNDNELFFSFSANGFNNSEKVKYQYRLTGESEAWSNWSEDNTKYYTNLWEGNYKFQVRARNSLGISETASFSFEILAPFYRTNWAYAFYSAALIALTGLIVRIRSKNLKKKNILLEKEVKKRTVEIEKRNELLKKQSIELETLNKMKSRFFANISHEFRTPLTLILGPLETIEEDKKFERYRVTIGSMKRNARRLLQLVNQLLDLSQLETGNLVLHLSQSSLNSFISRIVSSFSSLAENRKIKLEFIAGEEKGLTYFDKDIIEKVITNLLSNAFKFTPNDGMITVNTKFEDETFHINVKDSGTGINKEFLDRIFERFFKSDYEQNNYIKGSGIGLSLCKELTERHRGKIEVDSSPGHGSEFKLIISNDLSGYFNYEIIEGRENNNTSGIPDFAGDFENSLNDLPSLDTNKTKLLLVDDNTDIRHYVKECLGDDYFIIEAKDGDEASDKAVSILPDLILSDVMMPKLDGFSFVEKMKTDFRTSHIPIILLTAKASDENKIAGLKFGADDYIVKPFNKKELNARVKNLLDMRKKLRDHFLAEKNISLQEVLTDSSDETFFKLAIEIIDKNLSDSNFNVNELCREIAMSQSTLYTKLKYLTGLSPSQFIRSIRIKRAVEMLEKRNGTISEIAYKVGFNNLSYFSKCFKEFTDHLPSDYLK